MQPVNSGSNSGRARLDSHKMDSHTIDAVTEERTSPIYKHVTARIEKMAYSNSLLTRENSKEDATGSTDGGGRRDATGLPADGTDYRTNTFYSRGMRLAHMDL